MGREVRRVPLNFDWPLKKVWDGFLMPDGLDETPCAHCKGGWSSSAEALKDLWYGYILFDPASTGSTPLRHDTPAVRARAERNVAQAPDFYGTGERAVVREGQRLADLFNAQWAHHLNQDDVDALVAENRLHDFTHTWSRETGWQKREPAVVPTAAQVNEWSLTGFGHDTINQMVCVQARCAREGLPVYCAECDGRGSFEAYPGQRAEAEAWEPTGPPEGEGWQLWENVTEGSPISPVFPTAEALAAWMSDPARGKRWVPPATAAAFIADGWAPSFVSIPETGVVSGVEWIGHHTTEEA
ncbi:hypothetical protein ACF06X_33755 [Streptomyces sp. NPDC015346]|uniref:hypothetical protein n=1 Tax=Streptomyces sp. NPDC015346 TaxID=3364954 RepID=UPI0037021785